MLRYVRFHIVFATQNHVQGTHVIFLHALRTPLARPSLLFFLCSSLPVQRNTHSHSAIHPLFVACRYPCQVERGKELATHYCRRHSRADHGNTPGQQQQEFSAIEACQSATPPNQTTSPSLAFPTVFGVASRGSLHCCTDHRPANNAPSR